MQVEAIPASLLCMPDGRRDRLGSTNKRSRRHPFTKHQPLTAACHNIPMIGHNTNLQTWDVPSRQTDESKFCWSWTRSALSVLEGLQNTISPASRAVRSAPAAAPFIRVVSDADVGPVKGVSELCIVQLPYGPVKVILVVKLHNAQHASPVPHHVCE